MAVLLTPFSNCTEHYQKLVYRLSITDNLSEAAFIIGHLNPADIGAHPTRMLKY